MEHRCLSPWKGAVVGGLIAFAWSAVSWTVLPFHNSTVHALKNPGIVAMSMQSNADGPGVYLIGMSDEEKSVMNRPFVFLSYADIAGYSMGRTMALGLLVQMIGAFLWTWILGKIPGLTLKDAALYGLFFGASVGVLGVLPYSVWWKFPLPFTLLYVADAAIAWTLASMALSRCYAAACALPAETA